MRKYDVLYQVVGVLVASAYGAHRSLADVDTYMPFAQAAGLIRETRWFVTRASEHFVDEVWDVTFSETGYDGQRIGFDGSSTDPRFLASGMVARRHSGPTTRTPSTSECSAPRIEVMPKDEMTRYRTSLGREMDPMDVDQIMDSFGRRG